MLMRATINTAVDKFKFSNKPGKHEVPKYFKLCKDGCTKCDTKRFYRCKKPD